LIFKTTTPMSKILIIEASRGIRNTLRERLEYEKYTVETADTHEEGHRMEATFRPDVVLTDSLCGHERVVETPFIVISGDNSVKNAVESVRAGAWDFIPKPIDMNHLLESIKKVVGSEGVENPQPLPSPAPRRRAPVTREIIGSSPEIEQVKGLIDKIAPSQARVLITGENGTGKELVARWLHEKSHRAAGPFVDVNCAAIPSKLIESELFGHEKGAFTSAVRQRRGKFEQASGGTLFLDEIGDMSPSAQAKVLRALQENRISRIGGDRDVAVDVRVVAATNKNLRQEIAEGRFREDLYHRLNVITINVPPLRERSGDIPELVNHFMESICADYRIVPRSVSEEALAELQSMPWSGNIRELHNAMERLIILGGDPISIHDVHEYVTEYISVPFR
jgi:DNA-binding NtrC family response regulator